MVNYFTKNSEGNIYLPAEVAVSKYLLKDGIINKFHSYIDPGVGIFGHAYAALSHSEATHKLPVPPNAFGEKDLGRLYQQILKFVEDDGNPGCYPPVYTHKESVPIVKAVLNYLRHDGNADDVELKVYPMHYLFFTLKKATAEIGENKKPESIYITDVILDRDQHEYAREISCDFHETHDNGKYCALSCVIRWAYMFSESMCNDLAIQMIPGCHVPQGTIPQLSNFNMNSSMYEDELSAFASVTSLNTNINTEFSEPKIGREYWESTSTVRSVISDEDFPGLGTKRNKKISNDMKRNPDHDDDDNYKNNKIGRTEDNLWATRSKTKVKPPNEDSFTFSSVITGHGRGIIRSDNSSNTSQISSQRGKGRG